ncbi:MAG TPA: glutamine--tRNA ligase [Buchnera sp. (in: enterobacteria)]|nr:glutamine--tRNA ligase [Buchnera sp. (in: enterobacteria)]
MNSNFIIDIINNDLQNGKYITIKTRFPPEPNGYLHLGHAKSICLNFGLAKNYNGTCNLRFDDTNPTKENIEYIESIKSDIKWLGFQWDKNVRYSSEYFDILYNYAIELINKELAYVDQLNKTEIRQYRGNLKTPGINSPYRNRSIKENLILFEKMKNGHFSEGTACLRAKIDMNSNFMIMRDPVLYRIIFVKHHQTKKKWCIYPTYDFAHCISDALEGITHSICTLEFQDNRRLYDWILQNINIKCFPQQYEYSRLNLEYTVLSKRKLNLLVKNKIVCGWDDPRMSTLSGLRKRGYTPTSIRNFCNNIGVTKKDNLIELSSLESCIRNDLNQYAPRAIGVLNPIKIILCNLKNNHKETLKIPNHPANPKMGKRSFLFTNELYIDAYDFYEKERKKFRKLSLGKAVRLRYAYIIKAEKIKKDKYDNIVEILCTCDLNTLGITPKNRKINAVIHWISTKNVLPAKFYLYNELFTIKNPEKREDFLNYINPQSLIIKTGFIESYFQQIENNCYYQLEREGYFYFNKKNTENKHLIFNRIVELKNKQHNYIDKI